MTLGILRLTSIIMMDKVDQPDALVPILAHLHLAPAILAVLGLQALNHVLIRDLPRYIAHDQIAIIRLLLIIRAMSFFVHLKAAINRHFKCFSLFWSPCKVLRYYVVICECVPIESVCLKPSFALCRFK